MPFIFKRNKIQQTICSYMIEFYKIYMYNMFYFSKTSVRNGQQSHYRPTYCKSTYYYKFLFTKSNGMTA